ncbi:MAG: hypothetical protein JWM95_4005 [Gemmatimonadetes bacterium]|nr:hypothetical protein [Gemmatimonadota bacterium]
MLTGFSTSSQIAEYTTACAIFLTATACSPLARPPAQEGTRCGVQTSVRARSVIDTAVTRRVVRFGSATEREGKIVLVGDDIPFFREARHDSLFTIFQAGKQLEAPPGTQRAYFPRIVVTGETLLVTTWTQPPDVSSRKEATIPELTTIWTAARGTSGTWSTSLRLDSVMRVFADGNGALFASPTHSAIHLIYPLIPPGTGESFVAKYTLDQGAWKRSLIPGTRGAVYASAVEAQNGLIAVVFVAPDAKRAHDANSIQVITSSNEGRSWGNHVVFDHGGAADPIVLVDHRSTFHILWRQAPTTPLGHAVIRHVVATTGSSGLNWAVKDDLTPAPGFLGYSAAVDGCGVIHLAYEDWHGGGDSGDVDYATWDGAWSPPRHLLSHMAAVDPLVFVDARGKANIFMLARPDSAPENGRWTNMHVDFPASQPARR